MPCLPLANGQGPRGTLQDPLLSQLMYTCCDARYIQLKDNNVDTAPWPWSRVFLVSCVIVIAGIVIVFCEIAPFGLSFMSTSITYRDSSEPRMLQVEIKDPGRMDDSMVLSTGDHGSGAADDETELEFLYKSFPRIYVEALLAEKPTRGTLEYKEPRLVMDFLSPLECDGLVAMVKENRVPLNNIPGTSRWQINYRGSGNPILKRISEKVANLTGLPAEHQEHIQVVRYTPGQYFEPHYDPWTENEEPEDRLVGKRRYTVLLYLNEGFDGGNTSFPEIGRVFSPMQGAALFFHNLYPEEGGSDAKLHPGSQHAGETVTAGEKWIANCWVREHPYHS
eukprot:gnl/MRDRNA2_/MRDRNA2_112465_c0_seq1.p1 gnl/MRDRNA2_/MRDRNA2_112465_c0~~gnl/MRDRNA2_/MRDRNA2_112465_c0_seq1.p1  ORF type:complete len:352 (+),score=40.96 gnl/MRDRNA2_/MRDRNA2_112465_c0_seq1:50-1057(+)